MSRATVRWVFYFAAVLIVGPIVGSLVASLRAGDGSEHATLLVNASIPRGVIIGFVALGVAAVMGAACARFTNSRAGLTTAGFVLVWAAWRGGQVDEVLRTAESAGPLWTMAVEGAIFGAAGVLAAALIVGVARRNPDKLEEGGRKGVGGVLLDTVAGPGVVAGVVTSIVVVAAIVWWLVSSEYKGQAILGALFAIVAGVAAGRIAGHRAPAQSCMIAVMALAVLGPAVTAMAQGSDILGSTYGNGLFPIGRLTPLDWLAAGFLGAPVGLAWATSMLEKQLAKAE